MRKELIYRSRSRRSCFCRLSAGAGLFDMNGYPSKGKAVDKFKPAADYSDVLKGRPLRSASCARAGRASCHRASCMTMSMA